MTATEKTKRPGFRQGLMLYAAILLTLILLGLMFFYVYLWAYERSRPEYALDRYLSSLDEKAVQELAEPLLSQVDQRVQSREESYQLIYAALQDLRYVKKSAESSPERLVYVLKNQDEAVGRVELVPAASSRLGFTPWQVETQELTLESLSSESRVTVPEGYAVYCGDYLLPPEKIVERTEPYHFLSEFYANYEDLPRLVTYSSGPVLGQTSLRVLAPDGRALSPEDLETQRGFADNCSEEELAEIRQFVDEYIPLYISYLSGASQSHTYNLFSLRPYTVPGSDLYKRLEEALGGMGWASSHGDYLQSLSLNGAMRLDDDRYVCDVTYLVDTYGQAGLVTTSNNSKLMLLRTDKGLLAMAQASY